jgi:hypothetical protein
MTEWQAGLAATTSRQRQVIDYLLKPGVGLARSGDTSLLSEGPSSSTTSTLWEREEATLAVFLASLEFSGL